MSGEWSQNNARRANAPPRCAQNRVLSHVAQDMVCFWFGAVGGQCAQILLPSAVHLEERLTVSQSVPEPASRQSDRYTQFGFFVSSRYGPKQQGGPSLESR